MNYDELLTYRFLPHAWQIDFFDDDTKQEWYALYHEDLRFCRAAYPELKRWTDLQLMTTCEEYQYQLYRKLTYYHQRQAEFLGYLYFYQEAQQKPTSQHLADIRNLLPTLWQRYGSGKYLLSKET